MSGQLYALGFALARREGLRSGGGASSASRMHPMTAFLAADSGQDARTITLVAEGDAETFMKGLTPRAAAGAAAAQFVGKVDSMAVLPAAEADEWNVAWGIGEGGDTAARSAAAPWLLAALPKKLPPGTYRLAEMSGYDPTNARARLGARPVPLRSLYGRRRR